jgi:hypothetical protein
MHRCIALMMRRARHLPATAPQSCCKTCHRSLPRAVPPGGRGSVRRHPTAQPREPRGLRHLAVPKVCSGQGRSGDRAGHVQAPAAPMQPQLVPRCRRCSHAEPFRRCVSLAQPAGWLAGWPSFVALSWPWQRCSAAGIVAHARCCRGDVCTADAANQVLQRASSQPMSSSDGASRFKGFSQHYEDYSPAADHLSMMRIAMHEMLMGKLDDPNSTITLFPGWPVQQWDVRFRLHGALNTTVEAECTTSGATQSS